MQRKHLEIARAASKLGSEVPPRTGADAFPLALAGVARSGPRWMTPRDLLHLQGTIGNRAVRRMAADLQRETTAIPSQRAMVEGPEKGKKDLEFTGPENDRFVLDEFDQTLTIFTSPDGPNEGRAIRMTYKKPAGGETPTLEPDGLTNTELLSPLRAKALAWLSGEQGTFQESEEKRKERVDASTARNVAALQEWRAKSPANETAFLTYQQQMEEWRARQKAWLENKRKGMGPIMPKPPALMPAEVKATACNVHTEKFARALFGRTTKVGGLDPRAGAIIENRAGAFQTLESNPAGPQAGDIVSYGAIYEPTKPGRLRRGDFGTIKHVGVFKSRRPGPNDTEIWTVVDGGQGDFARRQETRERTRIFQKERLEVSIAMLGPTGKRTGARETAEMECGVLKSKLADAGQSMDDKLLRGWIDIDQYFGTESVSEATATGANNPVFVGKTAPIPDEVSP